MAAFLNYLFSIFVITLNQFNIWLGVMDHYNPKNEQWSNEIPKKCVIVQSSGEDLVMSLHEVYRQENNSLELERV